MLPTEYLISSIPKSSEKSDDKYIYIYIYIRISLTQLDAFYFVLWFSALYSHSVCEIPLHMLLSLMPSTLNMHIFSSSTNSVL